jgi:GT2 family glycosyltransferase
MIDVSVLVINYNTAGLVKKCIESLLNQQDVNLEIIVVDNNSHDNSAVVLQEFASRITLISNQDNKGFGKANNQAFKLSKGRYIFMLNPDAACLTRKDLLHVMQFMDAHPECGLAGTRIVNSHHQLAESAFYRYPRQKQVHLNFSDLPGLIASVLGASMIVRREVFESLNGFDEDFFLYSEETDLCLRIRKSGYMIGYCEAVTVQHAGSASEKDNLPEEVLRKKKAGKLLFYRKHYPESDVRKMMRRDLFHARFHLLRLMLIKWVFGLNKKQQKRYHRQIIACDMTCDYLKS